MKPLLVPGGRAFVWPSVQRVQRYYRCLFIKSFDSKLFFLQEFNFDL